jgi:hypothetical protein
MWHKAGPLHHPSKPASIKNGNQIITALGAGSFWCWFLLVLVPLGIGSIQGYFMSRKRDRDTSDVSRSGLLTLGEGYGPLPLVPMG